MSDTKFKDGDIVRITGGIGHGEEGKITGYDAGIILYNVVTMQDDYKKIESNLELVTAVPVLPPMPFGGIICNKCDHEYHPSNENGCDNCVKEDETPKQQFDPVTKPEHYQLLPGVEVIDVHNAILAKAGQLDPLVVAKWSRSWEYMTRAFSKYDDDGLEDFKKAQTYLTWLIEYMEGNQ